jgi:hypothetical protein
MTEEVVEAVETIDDVVLGVLVLVVVGVATVHPMQPPTLVAALRSQ